MVAKINHDSPVPLYYQLKEVITEGINSGEWGIGDLIPSENQLCRTYGVSRNTAQRALDELVHEGILTRRQGVGTFVTAPRIEQALSEFYSFSDAVSAHGYKHTVKVPSVSIEKASAKQAKALNVEIGESIIVLTRLRFVNDVPFILETSYIPEKMAPGLDKLDFEKESLYKTLTNSYRIYVTKAREFFEPVLINKMESQLLRVDEGSPAILLERVAFSPNDEVVEFCRSVIPGGKCRFYTELR